jgi:hypothetical protein
MRNILYRLYVPIMLLALLSCKRESLEYRTISGEVLKDKIAGGWAGKMIGVTYGAPTEFRAQAKTFEDSILWVPDDVIGALWQDDIYVQLTFLMTMDQYGMDAPAKKFQELFARAGYPLWHANVQARKNYFDSIFPPKSGQPEYNLHADDIDFQIEADYIGFMCPGMPQTAGQIADKIGHIMNYGDGIYGGIFVAALYAEAYFDNNISGVIEKALLSIPAESDYAKTIRDVIILHDQYPDNWRTAWKELESKWGDVDICGAGIPFNIDAKLNGAYIVMGLLYGDGDPVKTMEVSARCGQDSDCNPSNAMAVLGVIKGMSGLPSAYQNAIREISDSLFINTPYSFNKSVENTLKYVNELVMKNGGEVKEGEYRIKIQQPVPGTLEVAFPDLVYDRRIKILENTGWELKGNWKTYKIHNPWAPEGSQDYNQAKFSSTRGDEAVLSFEGTGISIVGNWFKDGGKADIFLDGTFSRTIDTYYNYAGQQHTDMDLWHVTGLPPGKHTIKIVVKGEKRPESEAAHIYLTEAVVFKTEKKKNETIRFSAMR